MDNMKINYDSLRDQLDSINTLINTWNEEMEVLYKKLESLIGLECFKGTSADRAKSYIVEVHTSGMIKVITTILAELSQKIVCYVDGFYKNVDSEKYTKVEEEYIREQIRRIKNKMNDAQDVTENVNRLIKSVNDIFPKMSVSTDSIDYDSEDVITRMNSFLDNAYRYDNTEKAKVDDLNELIASAKVFLQSALNKDDSYISNYESGAFANFSGFQNLYEGLVASAKYQDDTYEDYTLACEHDSEIRKEIYDELVEQKKEEAALEIAISAAALVGAVAFTVATCGAGAPTLIGAVGLVTATAAGTVAASNMVEGAGSYYLACNNDITTRAFNPIRDVCFGGDDKAYGTFETVVNTSFAIAAPLTSITSSVSAMSSVGMSTKQVLTASGKNIAKSVVVDTAATAALDVGVDAVGDYYGWSDTQKLTAISSVNAFSSAVSIVKTKSTISKSMAEQDNTKSITCCGDPINSATGAYTIECEDFSVEDISGEFHVIRRYSSTESSSRWMGGYRWLFGFESVIEKNETQLIVLMPDGHVERFEDTEQGFYIARGKNRKYTLEETDAGYKLQDNDERQTYIYNERGNILYKLDKNHNRIIYARDNERLCAVRFPGGNYLNLSYNADGFLESIEDKYGRKLGYTYSNGLMSSIIYPDGTKESYVYDEEGRIISITSVNGAEFINNEYDKAGRVVCQRLVNGQCYKIIYDDINKRNTFFCETNNSKVIYSYNEFYEVTRTEYDDGTADITEYDIYGSVKAKIDRRGNAIRYDNNIYGKPMRTEYADGLVILSEYDKEGNVIQVTDNARRERIFEYDSNSNLILEKNRIDNNRWNVRAYEYDEYGRLLCEKDSYDRGTVFEYNGLNNRPVKITRRAGQISSLEYDEAGRKIKEKTGNVEISYEYDIMDNIIRKNEANGNTERYFFTQTGKPLKKVMPRQYDRTKDDGLGKQYRYDGLDDLVETITAMGSTSRVKRDAERNIIKNINPAFYDPDVDDGEGTAYDYDIYGNIIRVRKPDGSVLRMFYDACGNIIKKVEPDCYNKKSDDGDGYVFEYDSRNRLIRITNPYGIIEKEMIYDKASLRVQELSSKVCNWTYVNTLDTKS